MQLLTPQLERRSAKWRQVIEPSPVASSSSVTLEVLSSALPCSSSLRPIPVYGTPVVIGGSSSSSIPVNGATLTIVFPHASASSSSPDSESDSIPGSQNRPAEVPGSFSSANPSSSSGLDPDATGSASEHIFSFTLIPPGFPLPHSPSVSTATSTAAGRLVAPDTLSPIPTTSSLSTRSKTASNVISFSLNSYGQNGIATSTGASPTESDPASGNSISQSSHPKRKVAGAAVGAIFALVLGTILAVWAYRRWSHGRARLSKTWISSPLLHDASDFPDDAYSPVNKRRSRTSATPRMTQVEPRLLSEGFLGRPVSLHARDGEMASANDPNSHLDADTWSTPTEPPAVQTTDSDVAVAPWLASDANDSTSKLPPTQPLRISAKGFMRRIRGRPSMGRATRGLMTSLSPVPESPISTPAMSIVTSMHRHPVDLNDSDNGSVSVRETDSNWSGDASSLRHEPGSKPAHFPPWIRRTIGNSTSG
ncbi:hypothetical protein MIND_00555300 [Mycena indigotica]|uniref:Uncharacterized protein n=1 Tax=Mycena indigotica TaxID=2126181 RepID=A0A8H6SZN4_9AGAR|nr:uncharacterized protein MIND_00555300 [Mycena indigotica]KAF7307601.1 hypothetical protein MIND_00555300 [Mycena indigotica]